MDEMAQKLKLVRMFIGDTADEQVFSDDELTALLHMNHDNVYLAAADALDILATNTARQMKCVTILDVTVNGQQSAAAIRESAAALRSRASEEGANTIQCGVVSINRPKVPTTWRPWWEALS